VRLLTLWDDLEDIRGRATGRAYLYRLAVITWSKPRLWEPGEDMVVPDGWAGHGGLYAMLRSHGGQSDPRRIAYIGKAKSFSRRLTQRHQHYDIVERRGRTEVSCGRIRYERIKARDGFLLELEDVVKYAVEPYLENHQGFATLPGFRPSQPRVPAPWVIRNEGYRFWGRMPKRIVYPAIGIEY
jgi:hypothetical protein